jgi:hypothetical protein
VYKLEKVALKILEYPKECNIGHVNKHGNTALICAVSYKLEKGSIKNIRISNRI